MNNWPEKFPMDMQHTLACGVEYALGRETSICGVVQRTVREHLHRFGPVPLACIVWAVAIKQECGSGLGAQGDKADWIDFCRDLLKQDRVREKAKDMLRHVELSEEIRSLLDNSEPEKVHSAQ